MEKHPFQEEVQKVRKSEYAIHPLILNRWSPRAMTGEEISDQELMGFFEAAHWAPSSYNNQPWRFLYAKRNSPEWTLFFNVMGEFNQSWTKNAAVLVVVISAKNFDHNNKPSRTHSFDAGAAWMGMALEAAGRGYVIHGMEGFDYEKAKRDLNVPDDYQVEAMVAIGKRAPISHLSPELQKRETPSTRKPLTEIIMKGQFKGLKKGNGGT